jgi:hypothetical protein
MYASAFVLGFHGCDESVGERILAAEFLCESFSCRGETKGVNRRPQAVPFTSWIRPRAITHRLGLWRAGNGGLKKPECRDSHHMPYKLRLEFPGAIYYIINRGNYRRWIFEESGAKAAFETCLFAACKRGDWRLHAFVIMGINAEAQFLLRRLKVKPGVFWSPPVV